MFTRQQVEVWKESTMPRKPSVGGIVLVLIVLGAIWGYFLYRWLNNQANKSEANWSSVVISLVEIAPRTTITGDMVDRVPFPKANIAPDVITNLTDVIGKVAVDRIKTKAQVRISDVAQRGQTPTYSFSIPPGKRAITISVDEVRGVGSGIKPEDRVDILVTYHDPNARQDNTKLVLQDVPVLWVNQGETDRSSSAGAKSSITLAVSPEDGELLTAAERVGVLRVMLRSAQDKAVVTSSGVRATDIQGGAAVIETPPTPPKAAGAGITIIRGTESFAAP
jgi:pilus assembly protein CpaB